MLCSNGGHSRYFFDRRGRAPQRRWMRVPRCPLPASLSRSAITASAALTVGISAVLLGQQRQALPDCMAARLTTLSQHIMSGSSGNAGGVSAGGTAAPAAGEDSSELSVFLLIGQSNMAGRGALPSPFFTPNPEQILTFAYDEDR